MLVFFINPGFWGRFRIDKVISIQLKTPNSNLHHFKIDGKLNKIQFDGSRKIPRLQRGKKNIHYGDRGFY